ncbi:MAG: HDOD domain-containing protein [Cognaticolwellia sp.]
MFKKLLKKLFKKPTSSASNLYYFEDSRKSAEPKAADASAADNIAPNSKAADSQIRSEPQQAPVASHNITFHSFEDEYQLAFYDHLLGASPSTLSPHDHELSAFISAQVQSLLKKPKLILDALPVLPLSLTKIVEQLNNKDFDVDALIELIQQEPAIAAKVIELANSSYYNRSHKEIVELKSAFMVLGVNGLSEGVINGFVSKLVPQSSIYFRHYGEKIWQHSLATGVMAKALVTQSPLKDSAAQAYFIGLICNLGDVIIYQLMIDAFSVVHPDCQPNSTLFKNVMAKNSKKITYFIAKYWNFPEAILEVLALQAKMKKSALLPALHNKRPIACYVYEAKILSELAMRLTQENIDDDYINEVATSLIFTDQAKAQLTLMLAEREIENA